MNKDIVTELSDYLSSHGYSTTGIEQAPSLGDLEFQIHEVVHAVLNGTDSVPYDRKVTEEAIDQRHDLSACLEEVISNIVTANVMGSLGLPVVDGIKSSRATVGEDYDDVVLALLNHPQIDKLTKEVLDVVRGPALDRKKDIFMYGVFTVLHQEGTWKTYIIGFTLEWKPVLNYFFSSFKNIEANDLLIEGFKGACASITPPLIGTEDRVIFEEMLHVNSPDLYDLMYDDTIQINLYPPLPPEAEVYANRVRAE